MMDMINDGQAPPNYEMGDENLPLFEQVLWFLCTRGE